MKISGNVYQLSDYGNQQGDTELYGPGADPAGRRRHWSGLSGTKAASGGDGKLLLTIILSSSVLYEMVGPVCAKMSLFLSGSITTEKMKEVAKEREAEIHEENLIARENEEHGEDDGAWENEAPCESDGSCGEEENPAKRGRRVG